MHVDAIAVATAVAVVNWLFLLVFVIDVFLVGWSLNWFLSCTCIQC